MKGGKACVIYEGGGVVVLQACHRSWWWGRWGGGERVRSAISSCVLTQAARGATRAGACLWRQHCMGGGGLVVVMLRRQQLVLSIHFPAGAERHMATQRAPAYRQLHRRQRQWQREAAACPLQRQGEQGGHCVVGSMDKSV
jgi:hypothetical protein